MCKVRGCAAGKMYVLSAMDACFFSFAKTVTIHQLFSA